MNIWRTAFITVFLAIAVSCSGGNDNTALPDGEVQPPFNDNTALPDGEVQPPFNEAHYYVATNGDDTNNGALDQPFATLERARQAVRDHKASEGIPENGLVVAIRGGVYPRNKSFTLVADDSGEQGRPVWWAAYPNETVRITGAARLEASWFAPVDDKDPLWDRLDSTVRDKIQVVDLSTHGITDYGTLARRGLSTKNAHSALELFVDGNPMELARWPNRGHTDPETLTTAAVVSGDIFGASTTFTYMGTTATDKADDGYSNYTANIGGTDYYLNHCTWEWGGTTNTYWFLSTHNPVTDPKPACWPADDTSWSSSGTWPIPPLSPFGGSSTETVTTQTRAIDFAEHGFLRTIDGISNTTFTFSGTRFQRWSQASDIWFQGLFKDFWADDTIRGSIDPGSGIVTLDENVIQSIIPFRPYFVLNLIEELDIPDEWWLDRSSGRLYYYPKVPLESADLAVSLLEDPLLEVQSATHLRLVDIIFEHGRGHLAMVDGVNDVIFQGSTFRGSGGDAVRIKGTNSGLERCVVVDSGGGGVYLEGGDRPTLTSGDLFVRNTELARFGRWDRNYRAGVNLDGCGNIAEHNHFHDAPHSAILFSGNEHRIEYNNIERVVLESSDAGAIYTGSDWGYRGNIIRYNLIRDIGSIFDGARGVYLDEVVSGITVFGNIIYNVRGLGTQSSGGRDNHFENNIIVDADRGAHSTDRRANTSNYNYDFDNYGRPDFKNLLGRINWDFKSWFTAPQSIAYQEHPWATRYPKLAALPNDWEQIQAGTWREPEGNIFANNIVWKSGGLISDQRTGGDNATDFYTAITPNLEEDPLFVDEVSGNLNLLPDSPVFNTPGFTFTPIPYDQIGIQP